MAPIEELRWSSEYKPAIGGISFYILFLVSYVVYLFLNNPDLNVNEELMHLGILLVVTIGFFTGLADDAFNTVPWLKFSAQLACGIIMVLFDIRINFFEFAPADAALTIFWVVAVMNSINMLDNMDAIAGIVCIAILIAAAFSDNPLADNNFFFTFICGGTVAAVTGFLMLNWHPAKIFMGDTGSQMLGALLAAIGVIFIWNNEHVIADHAWYSKLALVGTAYLIPIADSLTVTINRIQRGSSPFVGGKDHTTHHLSYAGLSDRTVAAVIIVISAAAIALITGLRFMDEDKKAVYTLAMLLFDAAIISLLYSTTHWKRAKKTFLERHGR